jgi:hypothetical protein
MLLGVEEAVVACEEPYEAIVACDEPCEAIIGFGEPYGGIIVGYCDGGYPPNMVGGYGLGTI